MKCLRCNEEMMNNTVITSKSQISYDICETCGSLWLDKGELDKMAYEVAGSIEYSSKDEAGSIAEPTKKCPRCDDSLLEKVFFIGESDIVLDHCRNCGGFWLDSGELNLINKELQDIMPIKGKGFSEFLNNIHLPYWYKRVQRKSSETDFTVKVPPLKNAELKRETTYKCPACNANLNEYRVYSIKIEGCSKCKGVWLDMDELRKLKDKVEKKSWGTLQWMDNESKTIEKTIGMISKRVCPKCIEKKLLSVSFDDSPVIIDWCPTCHGIWLDRDEFNEIKDYLRTKLDSLSSAEMRTKVAEELKEIWTGPEGKISEILDAKAAIAALINITVFEHPKLAKLLLEISKKLLSIGF